MSGCAAVFRRESKKQGMRKAEADGAGTGAGRGLSASCHSGRKPSCGNLGKRFCLLRRNLVLEKFRQRQPKLLHKAGLVHYILEINDILFFLQQYFLQCHRFADFIEGDARAYARFGKDS